MNDLLRLTLFGPPQIQMGERLLTGFSTNKAQALFFYLAVTSAAQSMPQPHSRDTLVKLLWSEMPDVNARQNLRSVLPELSRLVGSHIHIERQSVAFDPTSPYWLDAEVFLRALSVDASVNLAARQAAVDLYRDEFLNGFYVHSAPVFEEWVREQRQRFHNLAVKALFALVSDYIKQEDYRTALPNNRKLLSLEPWSEPAHRQQMLILARLGERGAALAQFKACQDILATEFGVEPLAETTALYEKVRSGEIEEIRDARHDESLAPPISQPAINALPIFVNEGHLPQQVNRSAAHFQVPSPVTALLGREQDLERAMHLLRKPDVRLVTVMGPPGVGKTRFSLELAHAVREPLTSGVFFVALAQISRGEDMPQALCDVVLPAYGARRSGDADALTMLKRVIADKRILLILDNFEHVLSDGTALLVSDLLAGASGLKVIITSREALQVHGEHRLKLDPLGFPAASALTQSRLSAHLQDYAAIALFVERAQASLPKFDLTEVNALDIAQLCAMLDGLPLAIEIAASHLEHFTLPGLLKQLKTGALALHHGQRDSAQRHQSLHTLISHSYNLLDGSEQRVFCALSVFASSADEAAVAAVLTPTHLEMRHGTASLDAALLAEALVLNHLHRLAAKNLITREIVDNVLRFSMLETLRDYGVNTLKANGQEFEHRHRHAQYFLAFANHANAQLRDEQYAFWMTQFELNHNNCRAALLWCLQHDTELGLALATAWADFWFQNGHVLEGLEWLGRLLGLMVDIDHATDLAAVQIVTLTQARALCALARFTWDIGPITNEQMVAFLEDRCVPVFRKHGDVYGEAVAKINIGFGLQCCSQETRGRAVLESALATLRGTGHDKDVVAGLCYLAILQMGSQAPQAVACAEEALSLSQKLGHPNLIAESTATLSNARRWTQDYVGAATAGQAAAELYRHSNDKLGLHWVLFRYSLVLLALKRFDDCRAVIDEYLEVGQQLGLGHVFALANQQLGYLAYLEGDLPEAQRRLGFRIEFALRCNDPRGAAVTLMIMVPVLARLGLPQMAVRVAEAVLAFFAPLDYSHSPQYLALLDEGLALAREELSAAEFVAAQAEGRSMSLEKAIAQTQAVALACEIA